MIKGFIRFLYLNLYGIILIVLGVVVMAIPALKMSVLLFIGEIVVSIFLLYKGIYIISQWGEKKRHYTQLISINKRRIKDESFESFIGTPCGRLLTRAVLHDLGKQDYYPILRKKYVLSFKESINLMRHPQPSIVVFSDIGLERIRKEEK